MSHCKFIVLLLLLPALAYGQIEEEDFDYSREFTWGINKNTNSGLFGGFSLKFSKALGENTYRTLAFDILNVRHPKEDRRVAPQTGTSFIFGKQNFLYTIRGQYGLERILFRKAPQQGVQINGHAGIGPSIGILAPYFVINANTGETEEFNPRVHTAPQSIAGSGRLFQGLGRSKIIPGLNAKASVIFEFGTFRRSVAGIELGFAAEIFTRKVLIVATQGSDVIFPTAFFTLFWGSRR